MDVKWRNVCHLIEASTCYKCDAKQKGAIGVFNADNLSKLVQYELDIDPFDMVADQSRDIYITSDSGPWESIYSYYRPDKRVSGSLSQFRAKSYIEISPIMNRIYIVNSEDPL